MAASGTPATACYVENGREYCTYRRGTYMYPCDESERIRMDMAHEIFLEARSRELHRAPIARGNSEVRILDLGTGTGIWAMDMADEYREAEVLGVDLANIQPPKIPANLRFNPGVDYLSPWALGLDSWDLIHIRQALGSVQNWPALYQKIFSHLKPGTGNIEQVEIDLEPRCDDRSIDNAPYRRWYEYLRDATRDVGRPIEYQHNTREMLERAGFVDIQESVHKLPFNTWPRDSRQKAIGRRYCACLLEGFEGLSLQPMTTAFGWSAQDLRPMLAALGEAVLNRRVHAYHNLHIWVARRPEG